MTKQAKDLRIVYMGTPDFAVAPLKALVEGGYNVVAVVTMVKEWVCLGWFSQAAQTDPYNCAPFKLYL